MVARCAGRLATKRRDRTTKIMKAPAGAIELLRRIFRVSTVSIAPSGASERGWDADPVACPLWAAFATGYRLSSLRLLQRLAGWPSALVSCWLACGFCIAL